MISFSKKTIVTHGTRSGYMYGCRCDKCKDAQAAYQRKRYRRIRLGREK